LNLFPILIALALSASQLALAQGLYETVLLESSGSRRTTRPVIRGRHYAVASMEPLATKAAERILNAGGNAFDAAVGGQAVLGLVAPASNGMGGDAVLLVYEGTSKKVHSINAEGTAPKLATIDWYKANHDGKLPVNESLLAGTVPGVPDAWYLMLDGWGTKTFAEVLGPAIELAENGFPAPDSLARSIRETHKLQKSPSSVRLYQREGKGPVAGALWRNPDLARTMKRMVEAERRHASQGRRTALRAARDEFYQGKIAQEMARFSKENNGLFRYEDFASYTAKVESPVSTNYRGYTVYKNASANQGPAELFALNMIEGFDVKSLGHNSADYIHASAEAIKLAMADRDKYLGDMDFITIPFDALLAKPYAAERRKLIDMQQASRTFRPGSPETMISGAPPIERPVDLSLQGDADHEGDTSYLSVVDRDRNAVSFTPSLHSGFGTGVAMGDLGFSFNCRGDYYSLVPGHANALAPGKRPRSTLQSTLITKDDMLYAVMGSPGGDDQCMRTMQTFLNLVEFGMNVQRAIEEPRWTTRGFPASPFPHTMYPADLGVESRISPSVREALLRKGHRVRVHGAWSLGSTAAIVLDPATGILNAGADPRVNAYAAGW
jgi:gamma-glutamyltranspeptidase/glutathione hydrolase